MLEAFDDPFGSAVAPTRAIVPTPVVPSMPGKPIVLTLPYPISANRYWRPVRIGAHITIVPTKEAKAYKQSVGWLAKSAGIRAPLAGRVHVDLALYPKRPQDWAKRLKADPLYWADSVMRLDLDNCRKVVYDALKDVAFGDDRCVWSDAGVVMEPDGREACVVVTITPLVKANPQGLIA